jgi:hypothetical protein
MRACLTGDLDISKSITRAIALWVHLGFAAEYQGLGGGMLTAEGAAVAKNSRPAIELAECSLGEPRS